MSRTVSTIYFPEMDLSGEVSKVDVSLGACTDQALVIGANFVSYNIVPQTRTETYRWNSEESNISNAFRERPHYYAFPRWGYS